MRLKRQGFTLIEITIVLLIVSILLGYTVALFPRQQELKQYRAVKQEMDRIMQTIVGFAQVNGRLPCPTQPSLSGVEDAIATGCNEYGGFVPINTLGFAGHLNQDRLLLDPWNNPYRYYVTDANFNGGSESDFTTPGEMRSVGLVDSDADDYIDLDGRYIICDGFGDALQTDQCTGAGELFGRYQSFDPDPSRYDGAPFVLVSLGKNGAPGNVVVGDELDNRGNSQISSLGIALGPSNRDYWLKDVDADQTTFVVRPGGFSDNYDDVVRWVSPGMLYSRMIDADKLP